MLLYHNHDFEFAQISGMTALDFLYAAVPASVLKCELDTCWIRYAGADPADYLRRYAERCPVVHLKDYVGDPGGPAPYALLGQDAPAREDGGQPFLFKPLGGGCQDIPALVEAAREAGTRWLVVEQDESPARPALRCPPERRAPAAAAVRSCGPGWTAGAPDSAAFLKTFLGGGEFFRRRPCFLPKTGLSCWMALGGAYSERM